MKAKIGFLQREENQSINTRLVEIKFAITVLEIKTFFSLSLVPVQAFLSSWAYSTKDTDH